MDLTTLFRVDDGGAVRLNGSRCRSCGAHAVPAREVCLSCHRPDCEETTVEGRGVVRLWTTLACPPAGFDEPISVGVVDLECGASIWALLTGVPSGSLVEAVPHLVRGGAPGFAFRPCHPPASL